MFYYFNAKDYAKASEAFLEGSKNPDAPIWMKVMAAKIAEEGESPETSLFLWKDIYNTTKDAAVKENALTHLQLMRAAADCKQIDALVEEYRKRSGAAPKSIGELVRAGLLRGAPVDPLGYGYTLDEDGKAELNVQSPLLEKQVMVMPKK